MLLSNLLLLFLLPPDVVVFLFGLVERRHITVKDSEKLVALSCRGVLTKQTTNAIELKKEVINISVETIDLTDNFPFM